MNILALKKEKNKIQILRVSEDFQDTYNLVHVYGAPFTPSILSIKEVLKDHKLYPVLSAHFLLVNLFLERIEVPNKRVVTDRPGTSKLIRKKDHSFIEIAYRRKNKAGEYEKTACSPNTCYIDNELRERFFRAVKRHGVVESGKYGDRYALFDGDQTFAEWSMFMDKEYTRLSGIDHMKQRKETKLSYSGKELFEWKERLESLSTLFEYVMPSREVLLFQKLSELGFCEVNESSICLYDRDGFFIQYFEDGITYENFMKLFRKLTSSELELAKRIIFEFAEWSQDK